MISCSVPFYIKPASLREDVQWKILSLSRSLSRIRTYACRVTGEAVTTESWIRVCCVCVCVCVCVCNQDIFCDKISSNNWSGCNTSLQTETIIAGMWSSPLRTMDTFMLFATWREICDCDGSELMDFHYKMASHCCHITNNFSVYERKKLVKYSSENPCQWGYSIVNIESSLLIDNFTMVSHYVKKSDTKIKRESSVNAHTVTSSIRRHIINSKFPKLHTFQPHVIVLFGSDFPTALPLICF